MKKWTVFTSLLYILTVANCRADNRLGQSCTTQSGTPGTFQNQHSCPSLQNKAQGSKSTTIVCCPHQTFSRAIAVSRRRKTTVRKAKPRKNRGTTPAPDPYATVCGRIGAAGRKRNARSTYDGESSVEYYDSNENITDSDRDYSYEYNMTTSMVVGGSQASPHSFPWMAALVEPGYFSSQWKTFCGGSLISTRFVLCAAHCVRVGGGTRTKYMVRLGGHSLTDGTRYAVDHTYVHPNYRSYNSDLSLIRLRQALTFTVHVSPICLPTSTIASSSLEGLTVTATGWGTVKAGGRQSKVLKQAQVRVVPRTDCNRSYSRLYKRSNMITANQICASAPGTDTCQGDSGGPLQYYSNGRWYQVGITSFGQGCAERQYPGVYTRVGAYVNWIKPIVNRGYK